MDLPESQAGARASVWLVDDSDLQAEIGRVALADHYEIRVFHDGISMLEALAGARPDLVVLDWQMPNLSGTELCRFIRETNDPGTLPILILTATSEDNLPEAFAAGANDFVRKPFLRTELVARAQGLIRNKQLYARLAEMEKRLRVEGEFRERFIAMLAHDLRQPLNTFVLSNETLGTALASQGNLARLVDIQGRTARRMARMVAELLDFARTRPETGMPIDREAIDFEPVVRAAVEEMRVGNPTRTFLVEVEGHCLGWWDRDRVAQVCSNLIRNAVDHSADPASPIEVRVRCTPEGVELLVANEGKPIPSSLLPTLFEPYRQGRTVDKKAGGLGLGLNIVREIVRAHGGSVGVESDAGRTAFRVIFPMGPPSATGLSSRPSP